MGLIALITIAYGLIQQLNWPRWIRHSLLGIVFGSGAWCDCGGHSPVANEVLLYRPHGNKP